MKVRLNRLKMDQIWPRWVKCLCPTSLPDHQDSWGSDSSQSLRPPGWRFPPSVQLPQQRMHPAQPPDTRRTQDSVWCKTHHQMSSPYLEWASNHLVGETQPNSLNSKESHKFNSLSIRCRPEISVWWYTLIHWSSQITAALRWRRRRSPASPWRELKMLQLQTPGEETAEAAQTRKWGGKNT